MSQPIIASPESAATEVAQIYATYRQPLLCYLRRLVRQPETAEDLCQETFLKAFRAWDSRQPGGNLLAWLYRIAANTAYDHLRRTRRIQFVCLLDVVGHIDGDYGPLAAAEAREPVRRALTQLSASQQLALLLHDSAGYSTQDIAAILGCSVGAAKTRLFRARARFRQLYRAIEA